jgi:UDP-glucose 4-epimerase
MPMIDDSTTDDSLTDATTTSTTTSTTTATTTGPESTATGTGVSAAGPVQGGHHVVVTGATGNVGTSLVPALLTAGYRVTAIERHRPAHGPWATMDGVRWCLADLGRDELDPEWFTGATATIHLAWAIQPSHRARAMFRTNVVGSRRLFEASVRAGVPHLVHTSSLATYCEAEPGAVADEGWPTDGTPMLGYAWQKAYVERVLDVVERDHPDITVTRVRPALVLKAPSAERVHKMFTANAPRRVMGALLPLVRRSPIAVQVVHSDDVADAVVRIVDRRAGGSFNLAAEPVLGSDRRFGPPLAAAAASLLSLAWKARLIAGEPGWIHAAAHAPILDCARARQVLDWSPRHDAEATIAEFASGLKGDVSSVLEPPAPIPAPG